MNSRKRMSSSEDIKFLLDKAKSVEEKDVNEARIWLLVGKSLAAQNFKLNYEAYLLEKRRKNAEEAAMNFEPLARKFLRNVEHEALELADAVLKHHFLKGKETEEQNFLLKIFSNLPKDIQLEILMQKSEQTPVLYEKCQCSLLLVKLYPDTVQQHGADLLFSVLSCESDASSTFRRLLVVELVPAVLQLNTNLGSSPKLLTLLNLCVEYYIVVTDNSNITPGTPNSSYGNDGTLENVVGRLDKIFKLVDRVGTLLQWKLTPFFNEALDNSSLGGIEILCQNLQLVFKNRHKYNPSEVAYLTAISFLCCLTTYSELSAISRFGNSSRMQLVEVFCPSTPSGLDKTDLSTYPVLTTISNDSCIGINQTPLLNCFQAAVKIWQLLLAIKGDLIEQEFTTVVMSMTSLKFDKWVPFQNFLRDYGTYMGPNYASNVKGTQSAVMLASMYCAAGNFQEAAEQALKIVEETAQINRLPSDIAKNGLTSVVISSSKSDDFSFFNSHIYSLDGQGNFIKQRRVHFISQNHSELIHYATNVLIRCFEVIQIERQNKIITNNLIILANEDASYGHLMTLLQLEWPSPPAENLFHYLFDRIKKKGSFSYYPFFEDFILEPDFLEHFASISYDDTCKVILNFFGTKSTTTTVTGSRRMATRGVDKGTKEEIRETMVRQMTKNGLEKLEDIIAKFLTKHKSDILKCFSGTS